MDRPVVSRVTPGGALHGRRPEPRPAGGIAHDFNKLLSVILSYIGLLLAEPKPTDSTTDEIEEIHAAALRAAELTRHLLMFSRKQLVAPRVLALNDVVAGTEKMVRRTRRCVITSP
jgi:C4-dicarboxylate-specific signal transduction histidine kinase